MVMDEVRLEMTDVGQIVNAHPARGIHPSFIYIMATSKAVGFGSLRITDSISSIYAISRGAGSGTGKTRARRHAGVPSRLPEMV